VKKTEVQPYIRIISAAGDAEPPRVRRLPLPALLAVILFFLFWASLLFTIPWRQFVFTPAWVFEAVRQRFGELYRFLRWGDSSFGISVWQLLAVALTGAALSGCGAALKGSFRNAMAGPSTMGVMAGCSLGALLYLLLFASGSTENVTAVFDPAAYAARGNAQPVPTPPAQMSA